MLSTSFVSNENGLHLCQRSEPLYSFNLAIQQGRHNSVQHHFGNFSTLFDATTSGRRDIDLIS